MNEALFIKRNRVQWQKLEAYASRLEGRGAPLTGAELYSLVSLYRKCAGDLSRARMLRLHSQVIDYLNHVVGRAHALVYAAPPYRLGRALGFFRTVLPSTVRRHRGFLLAASLLVLLPALASFWAVQSEPSLVTAFAPPGYVEQIDKAFGNSFGEELRPAGMSALATSFYIVNNMQVAFLAFATGAFLGLGSAYFLAYNGMILGGVAAAIHQRALSYNFWSFVASHGVIEMAAIVLSGAAGLRIGCSLINPGPRTRKAALMEAGRDAGVLVFGAIFLLGIAAVLEAWISPSTLPNGCKLALGGLNLLGLVGYLLLVGRGGETRSPGPHELPVPFGGPPEAASPAPGSTKR